MSDKAPAGLDDLAKSVQFLRNLGPRCIFALSSFYLLMGTRPDSSKPCTIPGFPGRVLQNQIHYSSLNTIALACRKAFDSGKGMTGAAFGRMGNPVLKRHAEHWSRYSSNSVDDSYRALSFLRTFFATFSKTPSSLYKQGTTLGRRIGFIKQYANGSAAHLSVDYYEYDHLDVAHLVAALALIGSVILSFDSGVSNDYFNEIDEAAYQAALALFPDLPKVRLFASINAATQGRLCWQLPESDGIEMLAEQLPYAISWF